MNKNKLVKIIAVEAVVAAKGTNKGKTIYILKFEGDRMRDAAIGLQIVSKGAITASIAKSKAVEIATEDEMVILMEANDVTTPEELVGLEYEGYVRIDINPDGGRGFRLEDRNNPGKYICIATKLVKEEALSGVFNNLTAGQPDEDEEEDDDNTDEREETRKERGATAKTGK